MASLVMLSKNHVILISVLICASAVANSEFAHILMKNDLGTGDIMTVRCTDKDGVDLGPNDVLPLIQYDLVFTPDWGSGGSRFNCSFAWPETFHYFMVYDLYRDVHKCGNGCCWNITRDHGPCLCSGEVCFPGWNKY